MVTSWHHSWLRSKVSHGIDARPVSFGAADAVLNSSVGAVADIEGGDVGVLLVGEERGEPKPVDVVEGLLRSGMQRFAAHDQPRPSWPPRQLHKVGDLGHCSFAAWPATLGERLDRTVVVRIEIVDGGAYGVFERHPDREQQPTTADVAEQVVDRSGRIGTHQHLQLIGKFGQLVECPVEHPDLIGAGVRPGVAFA